MNCVDYAESMLAEDIRAFANALNTTGTTSAIAGMAAPTPGGTVVPLKGFEQRSGGEFFSSPVPGGFSTSTSGTTSAVATLFSSSFEAAATSAGIDIDRDGKASALLRIKETYTLLKQRSDELLRQNGVWQEALKASRKECDDTKKRALKAEQQLQVANHERQVLEGRLQQADDDITAVEAETAAITRVREELLAANDESAQRVRTTVREIDGLLADAVSRSHAITGGRAVTVLPRGDPSTTTGTPAKKPLSGSSISTALVAPGSASGKSPATGTGSIENGIANALLTTCAQDVARALDLLNATLEAVQADNHAKRLSAEKQEANWQERQSQWTAEKKKFTQTVVDLEGALKSEREQIQILQSELSLARTEADKLRSKLNDVSRNNAELEIEIKTAGENNTELRTALGEAESLCMELRGRIRNMQMDADRKTEDMLSLTEQYEATRKRATDSELLQVLYSLKAMLIFIDSLIASQDALFITPLTPPSNYLVHYPHFTPHSPPHSPPRSLPRSFRSVRWLRWVV
jgi:predicted  nucleic acid-binding Zn-ribbon protein